VRSFNKSFEISVLSPINFRRPRHVNKRGTANNFSHLVAKFAQYFSERINMRKIERWKKWEGLSGYFFFFEEGNKKSSLEINTDTRIRLSVSRIPMYIPELNWICAYSQEILFFARNITNSSFLRLSASSHS